MENMDVRLKAKGTGVPLWRIAKEMGVSEPTMTRKLRSPLNEVEKEQIFEIIRKVSED